MRHRGFTGIGYPVLPDQFVTAAGLPEAFSPGSPDALIVRILQGQGQQLPADLAAKLAAAQTTATTTDPTQSPANPAPGALTPSGQPISTQTGAAITLLNTIAVAPGVWTCVMSDGSSHYCDVAGKPISYTPPAPAPATTPAAGSQPTQTVAPAVTPTPSPTPAPAPVAVTPAGGQISTTTGTPQASIVPTVQGMLDSVMTWLKGSLIGGVPNWALLGGAAAILLMFSEDGGAHRRR